jgi:tetratricopeptide (TPR) repeat protein
MKPESQVSLSLGSLHIREYTRLLRHLHLSLAAGDGDSPEANRIRDELEGHLPFLTQQQYHRAEGLCEDLYSLVEDSPSSASANSLPPRNKEDYIADVRREWGEDWDRVLQVIREGAKLLPLAWVSYVRGRAWEELGDPDTALLFFDRARQLDPENAGYIVLEMSLLLNLGRSEEAVAIAEDYIERTDSPALLGL